MRFLRKNKFDKTILVISDIHLGAGAYVNERRNYLEDFHYDEEMVDFLNFYSSGDYANREVELIINGDLFDLLAVPHVPFFDDEFWSEKASMAKLKLIIEAHQEVMEAFANFISHKKKKIIYIIGNHDAELVFPSLREYFLEQFPEKDRANIQVFLEGNGEYVPAKGIVIKHGHQYEIANDFDPEKSIVVDSDGEPHFVPPWGSYYVTRVINKFKEERGFVNAVRPIKKFIINGLIYDTLFTVRFGLSNFFYFFMVRFIGFFRQGKGFKEVLKSSLKELQLFRDYEALSEGIFQERPDLKILIVGHTHEPIFRTYADGTAFINTGTWTRMFHLDFGKSTMDGHLTYAQIDLKKNQDEYEIGDMALNSWKGRNDLPFQEFN